MTMKAKYKVTVKGPLLVNGDKNLIKGVRKALVIAGKDAKSEIVKKTPHKSGKLRRNIKEGRPTVNRKVAEITISAGSSHGGASGVKTNAIGDVIYGVWVETGVRRNQTMKTRKGGYKMFEQARDIIDSAKHRKKMAKTIAKQLGG
jgi:hypothetical protein